MVEFDLDSQKNIIFLFFGLHCDVASVQRTLGKCVAVAGITQFAVAQTKTSI